MHALRFLITVGAILVSTCAYAHQSKSYLVADDNGTVLKEHRSSKVLPIASITKLMVAVLVSEQDMDEQISLPKHRAVSSKIPISQSFLSRGELLKLALIKSDNLAALILCDNYYDCIPAMNRRAAILNMTVTHYVEPTGLSSKNVSSANDLLRLMKHALTIPIISEISSMPTAKIHIGKGGITIRNTNPLTNKMNVMLSKTGFTNPAGGCLIMVAQHKIGRRYLIILGSRNTRTRITEMEKLYSATY